MNKVKAKGRAKANQEQKELVKIMDAIKICAVIQEMSEEDDDWYCSFTKLIQLT